MFAVRTAAATGERSVKGARTLYRDGASTYLGKVRDARWHPGCYRGGHHTIDWERGVIRGEAAGFWALCQATEQLDKVRLAIHRVQCCGLPVTVIVDPRAAAPQSQEVSDVLSQSTSNIFQHGDRVAIVVANSLVKLQMRRVLEPEYRELFLSMDAAEKCSFASDRQDGDGMT